MECCVFDATIFPNRIRITFGQFSTTVKRAWAAREEERGHEQSEHLPGKFCSLHSVKADAGGGEGNVPVWKQFPLWGGQHPLSQRAPP